MRRCFFIIQTSENICFVLFKTIILLFFTILQDKLYSFNHSRTSEARASFAHQIIELITLQNIFMKRIQHNEASVQSEKYASMSYVG